MKTKKISLFEAQSALSKNQMKKIMASSGGGDGDCAAHGDYCNTVAVPSTNCCSGLVCAEQACFTPTR